MRIDNVFKDFALSKKARIKEDTNFDKKEVSIKIENDEDKYEGFTELDIID